MPGDSIDYTWEEPMKPHKLIVRAGIHHKEATKEASRPMKNVFPFNIIGSEDQAGFGAPRTIKLDEIGFVDVFP